MAGLALPLYNFSGDAAQRPQLLIDAYRGAIDSDGEIYDDALAEMHAYLNGECGGPPWLTNSRQAFLNTRLVGACLVGEWSERQLPEFLGAAPTEENRDRILSQRLEQLRGEKQ